MKFRIYSDGTVVEEPNFAVFENSDIITPGSNYTEHEIPDQIVDYIAEKYGE